MSGLATVYPPPPYYFESFTDGNLKELQELGEDPVPESLEFLRPPPAPETPTYRGFGSIWNAQEKLLPLQEAGIKQLYSSLGDNYENLVPELKKLLKAALVDFVTLTGLMSLNPEQFPTKVEDLRTIFVNMHHLLNLYRPHQSRESLVLMMSEQIETKRKEIAEMKQSNQEIQERIELLCQRLPNLQATDSDDKPIGEWQNMGLDIDQP